MEPPVLSASMLASSVRAQVEAAKDTVMRSERVLQNTEAILGDDTPRGDEEEIEYLNTIIPQPTPQQTAEHSTTVHHDISYAKHYLAQTQERIHHSNKQDPLEDPNDEQALFNPKQFYNNFESITENEGIYLAVESVGHTTGVLSKSVQEQIKASKTMMQKSTSMMDSIHRFKAISSNSTSSTPPPPPLSTSPVRRTPPPYSHPIPASSTPPPSSHSRPLSSTPPPMYESDSDNGDDMNHLRKIYLGKKEHPSASIDKILTFTNSVYPSYGKAPSNSKTAPPTDKSSNDSVPKSNQASNTPPVTRINNNSRANTPSATSPAASRASSSLDKPKFSIPPLTFPRPPSPLFISYNPNPNKPPKSTTIQTRPLSAPPTNFPLTRSSTSHSPIPRLRATTPSLPISQLSHLDLSPTRNARTPNPTPHSYAYPVTPTSTMKHPPSSTNPRASSPTPTILSRNYPTTPTKSVPTHSTHIPTTAPTPTRTTSLGSYRSGNEPNPITVAMVSSLTPMQRDEYVDRIKARNRSSVMTGESILDRFFSNHVVT